MTDPIEILRSAKVVVLHDWPSEDVPNALVLAGLDVTFQGGPEPDDLYVMRLVDGHPETSPVTSLPERADIIYSHRPAAELPRLLAEAQQLGATTLWHQSGRNEDGEKDPTGVFLTPTEAEHMAALAHEAGVAFVSSPYIVEAAAAAGSEGRADTQEDRSGQLKARAVRVVSDHLGGTPH
jgi:predicted CoA-binding protein